MQSMRGTWQPIGKKEAQGLYVKYMGLALDAQAQKDRALFNHHYGHAEYYLRLMNKLGACWPVATPGQDLKSPRQGPMSPFKEGFPSHNRRRKRSKIKKPMVVAGP